MKCHLYNYSRFFTLELKEYLCSYVDSSDILSILFSIEEEHFILYKKENIIKRPICLWSIFNSRFEIQHFIFVNLHYILFYLATSKFPFQGAMYNQRFIYWSCSAEVRTGYSFSLSKTR